MKATDVGCYENTKRKGVKMSEVTMSANAGSDVVFNHVRAKSVPDEKFAKTYAEMALAGKTAEEIATALGMNKASVVTRASALRKEMADLGATFPFAKTNRGKSGRTSSRMPREKLKEWLAGLSGNSTVGQ